MASSTEMQLEMTEKTAARTGPSATTASAARRRGRPTLMSTATLLERIRQIASGDGLYRVHQTHSNLYARARRKFGTWANAVRAAGLDYGDAVNVARRRSVETRRRLRRQRSRLGR